jgi:hypothetical protein
LRGPESDCFVLSELEGFPSQILSAARLKLELDAAAGQLRIDRCRWQYGVKSVGDTNWF